MSQQSPQREKPGAVLRMLLPFLQLFWPKVGTPVHVRLYRRLGGSRLVGGGSLLLTTVGRRSGQPRTVIVGYSLREGDDVIVVDTNIVKPTQPAWVRNLRAHPEVEVQLGRERYRARSEILEEEDRAGQWDRLVAADPGYDWVRRVAGRERYVIRLRRITGSSE
jgi:deazaflavin-dependent oxidoreductase (nitroreductase family)